MRQKQMFDEPLRPPVDGQVLRVSRWPEVFETAHSRKHATLRWISCPVSFNSTGYQRLLDGFDTWEAAALYGAWQALCQLAAQSELRGRLCGQKGEPYNTRRIARLTGMGLEIFEVLIPWALQVGWLEWALPHAAYKDTPISSSENAGNTDDSDLIPQVGIVDSELSPLPNLTQPNPTKPNPTQPVADGGEDWNSVQQQLQQLGVTAARKAAETAQRAGWSVDLASGVLQHFREHPTAYTAFQLYERFQAAASVAASDGWPAASAEFQERRRRQRAEEIAAAEQAARDRERAAKREQLQAEKRAGPITSFAEHAKKLAERKAVQT